MVEGRDNFKAYFFMITNVKKYGKIVWREGGAILKIPNFE